MTIVRLVNISRGHPNSEPIEQDIAVALAEMAKWAEQISGSIEEITTLEGGLERIIIKDKNGNPARIFAVC